MTPGAVRSHDYALPRPPLAAETIERFLRLDAGLTERKPIDTPSSHRQGVYLQAIGSLTTEGLQWVIDVIRASQLPVTFASDRFGFNSFRATVYDHRYIPLHGNRRQLAAIFTFSDSNLPWQTPEYVDSEQRIRTVYARLLNRLAADAAYNKVLQFYGFELWPADGAAWVY